MEFLIVPVFAALMQLWHPNPTVDRITLLPDATGKAGEVVVTTEQGNQPLSTAFGSIAVKAHGELTPEEANQEQAQKRYGELLAMQPKKPVSFNLYFMNGKDALTEESTKTIAEIKCTLQNYPAPQITVIGHTDRVGKEQDNDDLSLRRAAKVRNTLVELGFEPSIIEAQGRGEREPLVPTDDEVAEPKNRRAEVNIR